MPPKKNKNKKQIKDNSSDDEDFWNQQIAENKAKEKSLSLEDEKFLKFQEKRDYFLKKKQEFQKQMLLLKAKKQVLDQEKIIQESESIDQEAHNIIKEYSECNFQGQAKKELDAFKTLCQDSISFSPQSLLKPEAIIKFLSIEGDEFFKSKDYDRAISKYQEVVKLQEDNAYDHGRIAQSYIRIAEGHIQKQEYKEALSSLNKIPSLDKIGKETRDGLTVNISFAKGYVFYKLADYKQLLDTCKILDLKYTLNDSDRNTFLCWKGISLSVMESYEEAVSCFSDCSESEEFKQMKAIAFYAEALYKIGSYEAALKYCIKAEDTIKPNDDLYAGMHQIKFYVLTDSGADIADLDKEAPIALAATQDMINGKSNLPKSEISNLYKFESFVSMYLFQYKEAIDAFIKAIKFSPADLKVYNDLIRILENLGIDTEKFREELAQFSPQKQIDISFLESAEIQEKILSAPKKEGEIVAKKSSVNQESDDSAYIATTFSKHKVLENLILEYISPGQEEEKELKKAQINKIITQDPSLKQFVIHLFATQEKEQAIKNIQDVFAADKPSLIDKFFRYIKRPDKTQKQSADIKISQDLEGVHEIALPSNFKASWFFKFTDKIIEKFKGCLSGITESINDLRIITEKAQGKVGFKKHEVKIKVKAKDGATFSMLKLAGLQQDEEIYSKKMYTYVDKVSGKTSILSILDSCGNHTELNTVINQVGHGFESSYVTYEEFESMFSGETMLSGE